MSPILEVRQLVKRYGNYTALQNIDLQVPEGSIFGLLGPNGAGKTSLIRIINQITAPDEGEVHLFGEHLRPVHTERIGYLPEERGLYRKMQVGEQCLYLAQLKGLSENHAKKKLRYWFEKFEIQSWWTKKVEELSKGMAQKIQFIVTVIHQPALLIFDEPFTGFDPVNAELITREILELQKQGATIIFSTHRMETVEALCNHIALIHQSKLILEGPILDVKRQYNQHLYELEFKGNMVGFTNALWTGFELVKKTTIDKDLHLATIRFLGQSTARQLFEQINPHVEICAFRPVLPTMNEIFIQTVTQNPAAIA